MGKPCPDRKSNTAGVPWLGRFGRGCALDFSIADYLQPVPRQTSAGWKSSTTDTAKPATKLKVKRAAIKSIFIDPIPGTTSKCSVWSNRHYGGHARDQVQCHERNDKDSHDLLKRL